ncbi:conserved exported hypothetical protein [Rhizobium sp. EC-SD404]|nr:conserved exported hypothetical protein [Rhizobium sp. EC-SD404]
MMKSILRAALIGTMLAGTALSGVAIAQDAGESPRADRPLDAAPGSGAASGTEGSSMTGTEGSDMSGSDAMASDDMAAEMPIVGGAPMDPGKTIPENASTASNLTTLVAAVQAADLVETLSGPGPFTVFAPTNDAFAALPAGTVDTLLEPANQEQLASILTYHVVPAEATSAAAMQMIADDGGQHEVTTVAGGTLVLAMDGDNLTVTDESGNTATVTQADVMQSNGVVHVIDTVLMPQ